MAGFTTFEEIEAWQGARLLVREIYQFTRIVPCAQDRHSCYQIQRAAISVMANIVEDFERGGNREFRRFLDIAKGSVGEVRSLLYIALDLKYLNVATYNRLSELAARVGRQIGKLIGYLQTPEAAEHDLRG